MKHFQLVVLYLAIKWHMIDGELRGLEANRRPILRQSLPPPLPQPLRPLAAAGLIPGNGQLLLLLVLLFEFYYY